MSHRLRQHSPHEGAHVGSAMVLTPRHLRRVPVQILARNVMERAPLAPSHTAEEALDLVGRDASLAPVGEAVIDALDLLEDRRHLIVGVVLVGHDQVRMSRVALKQRHDDGRVLRFRDRRDDAAVALADGDDALALAGLVLAKAPVDAVLGPVLWTDVAADIHAVDLDGAFQHQRGALGGDRLTELHQVGPSGLVLDAQLASDLEGSLALHGMGRERDGRQQQAEPQLPVREDRPAGHAELVAAALCPAFEATAARLPGVGDTASWAVRDAVCLRPAGSQEPLVGSLFGHAEDAMQRQRPALLREQVVLGHGSAPRRAGAVCVAVFDGLAGSPGWRPGAAGGFGRGWQAGRSSRGSWRHQRRSTECLWLVMPGGSGERERATAALRPRRYREGM